MQLKEKPELHQINQKSEALVKIYQPDRPIKERKSVARVDRTNLQPLKEPKAVATVERTNLQPLKEPKSVARVDRTNLQPLKEPKAVATVERTNLQPIKEPKSVARVERTNLQPIKEPKSVARVERTNLQPIKEPKSVARVERTNLQPLKEPKSVARVDRQDLQPIKERESVATTLLKIILIYFPLGILRILFSKFSVVSIIIGNLASIVLADAMFCGTQTRPARARQYIDSMNRAQQQKYADNGAFSNSLDALGFEIKTDVASSRNYNYSIGATKNAAFSYAVNNDNYSYVGAVFLVPVSPASNNEMTTVSILCVANPFRNKQAPTQPPNPILQNGVPVCAAGTKSEAHQYVGSLNSSQKSPFPRRDGFSNSINSLLPGQKQTTNYKYSISARGNAAFSYGVSRSNYFHSYVGAVFLAPVSSAVNNENTRVSILCVANSPGKTKPANPILQYGIPVCAAGSSEVSE